MDATTIKELTKAEASETLNDALVSALDTQGHAALVAPQDFKLHDLEPFMPIRRRARGKMATTQIASFAAYTTQHAETGASVFVDPDTMTATAVLNLGTPDEPGHADNVALLKAQPTAEFSALWAIADGRPRDQAAVAEWMEDWLPSLSFFSSDDNAINPKTAVAAVRRITLEAIAKHESAVSSLSAERSSLESVTASAGALQLPAEIIANVDETYQGLPPRSFRIRVGVLTGEKTPKLILRIIKREDHVLQMAAEFASTVKDAIGDTLSVGIGTYVAR